MVEEEVLNWLIKQMSADEIEEVTDKLLDLMIRKHNQVAVVFCKLIWCHCAKKLNI